MYTSSCPALQEDAPNTPGLIGQQPVLQALLRNDPVHRCASLCSRAAYHSLLHLALESIRKAFLTYMKARGKR